MKVLALLLVASFPQDAPAPTLQPRVPPLESESAAPPAPGDLARDGHVTGVFSAEGQSVRYGFEARAGELSLFDLGNWGMARGWTSTVGLRLLGPRDEVLVDERHAGATVFRDFQAFVAPAEGRYTLELSAAEHHYRFTLVRHSGYAPRAAGEVRPFGDAPLVHGYLADTGDRASFVVELEAGVPVLLRASLTHPQGEQQAQSLRGRQALRVARGLPLVLGAARRAGQDEAAMRAMRREGGASASFPGLVLEVTSPAGASLAAGRHAALFTPDVDGPHVVTVAANSRGEGGLFDLALERGPARVRVTGYVGDRDDNPVPGVQVYLLLEPGMDPVGAAESDAQGGWSGDVPPGPYTVLLTRGEEGPIERLQTRIDAARELNAIWTH